MTTRTRFAPSPTGSLHIGGVRTALYSWAIAKQSGGEFLLRIEDTDQERKVPGAITFIIRELQWLGLKFDKGPTKSELEAIGEPVEGLILPDCNTSRTVNENSFIQSFRKHIYKKYAEELVQNGYAYRCDCTPEMLERERREQMLRREKPGYSGRCRFRNVPQDKPHAIRLRLPDNFTVTAHDAIRGIIKYENPPLRDPVLLKSDGFPTYHLAVVVDDHLMKISHVLRGEEWLATFPIHWYLYELFGWTKPVFVHLPVILGDDGKKLSKRHGAVTTAELREEGYLPEAILNSLALVGWSHPEGKELFCMDEFVQKFSIDRIHPASGVLSFPKMKRFNHEHIKMMSNDRFLGMARSIVNFKLPEFSDHYLDILKERCHTLKDIAHLLCFLDETVKPDYDQLSNIATDKIAAVMDLFQNLVSADFSRDKIAESFNQIAAKTGLKKSDCFKIIRIATLKRLETPPIVDTLLEFGKEWTLDRINRFKSSVSEILNASQN